MSSNARVVFLGAAKNRQGAARSPVQNVNGRPTTIADSHQIAAARVALKVAALACAAARMDPSGANLARVAEGDLARSALEYFRTLRRATTGKDPEMMIGVTDQLEEAQKRLVVSALAYTTSRHGADSCVDFSRAAIGIMCQAAVRLGEILTGMAPGACEGDPSMHLEDGR